ncbi:phenylalanyl-tRNA synthetase subunit alpha [Ignicoccus islandicus DSM 13165]|uniref:phenylalanine--tRNA ligase n=1 Tax=Ignicoccus islandicus DSM 13165 TaxID=940295 RepID=A0A0U3F5V9_9CREN|nr:phenylalanine--tRNA ligase subunit alpha [Ignicoccus islandicus]ALU11464.1 phenylalanyl-tRNA synthetase subunit alpha [Ignicoccus islandicus DSM 13165]
MIYVTPTQMKIVELIVEKGIMDIDEIAKELGKKREDLMRELAELQRVELVEVVTRTKKLAKLNDKGVIYLKRPLPEEVVLELLEKGDVPISQLKDKLEKDEISAALGKLKAFKVVKMEKGVLRKAGDDKELREYIKRLKECISKYRFPSEPDDCFKLLKERGFVETEQRKIIEIKPTNKLIELWNQGKLVEKEVVTKLTSEMITSGKWKEITLKKFDLTIEMPSARGGKRHPLTELYDHVREVLISMGFEEASGNFVEHALWNFDVLLVPQYHPARYETDVFYVENAELPRPPEDVIERAKAVHERLYRYKWEAREALRLLLRTHTTAVSAHQMYERGDGEYKVFSLDRVFRSETLDQTHSMEFHQLEGIVVGRNVKFNHLLGFFKEFSKKMGLGEVKFKPAYFPFTEPSVEGFIRHPKLGWIEVFPGGMFRPELLEVVGLSKDYKVIAWGIGIDRIAMMLLDLDDIRDLYTNDLVTIRSLKQPLKVILGASSKG